MTTNSQHHSSRARNGALLALGLVGSVLACSASPALPGPPNTIGGVGGTSSSATGNPAAAGAQATVGGNASAGGTIAQGGSTSTSSTVPTGGNSANGGAIATTGGSTNMGGSMTMGGAIATNGGSTATGGVVAATGGVATTGGSKATGGNTATGGTIATGGAIAAGGAVVRTEVFVGPAGLDTNPGTEALPYKTINWAMTIAPQGGTIWVLPGTYAMTAAVSLGKPGLVGTPTKLWARSGRPSLDWAGQAVADSSQGLIIAANYWHIRGLELANAGDNCILITGSNNTIEDTVVHNCKDSGIQISVPSAYAGNAAFGANNKILNCDSYSNVDATGENADGFAAKLRIGPGNVFQGCRAWSNSDDGWDFFAANDVVTITNSWAFMNGSGTAGDGNGFKLGGASDGTADQGGAVHIVNNTAAFENRGWGYTRNNNTSTPQLASCQVRANGSGTYSSLTCSPSGTVATTGTAARTMARNADGSLPAIP